MLRILADAWRVAMPPFGEDFVGVGQCPIVKALAGKLDAGFFPHLAASGGEERFIAFAAAGY